MICISCNSELNAAMQHAMTINSCPFCGKNIFTSKEFDLRMSIQKILIRNNIDNDEQRSVVVDDISNYFRELFNDELKRSEGVASVRASRKEPGEQEEVEEDFDDGMGSAPTRKLTPDPRRLQPARSASPNTSAKINEATRIWEETQRIEDDDRPAGAFNRVGSEMDQDEDVSGVFMMESAGVDERVERLKQAAANAKKGGAGLPPPPAAVGASRPSFKNRPKPV